MDPKLQLSQIAEKWKNVNPRLYEAFLLTLAAYVQDVTVAVTEASNEDILCFKGRAQQARAFYRIFVETQPSP